MKKTNLTLALITIMVISSISTPMTSASSAREAYDARRYGPGGGSSSGDDDNDVPSGGTPITGNRYALVIGISDYTGDSSDLNYADDDARDWYNYLVSIGYEVTLLIDEQATKENILNALQDLADKEKPGDGVVITYSGHGYYSRQADMSMIITWELTGLTTDEIKAITDTFETEHVYFFDDACNQGTMRELARPGWLLAIGSQERTYTYDGTPDMANGIFTYYMMEALYTPMYIMEDASAYAIQMFESTTSGDAFMIDAYTGDFYL